MAGDLRGRWEAIEGGARSHPRLSLRSHSGAVIGEGDGEGFRGKQEDEEAGGRGIGCHIKRRSHIAVLALET